MAGEEFRGGGGGEYFFILSLFFLAFSLALVKRLMAWWVGHTLAFCEMLSDELSLAFLEHFDYVQRVH